jgi:hypothetical protein
MANGVSTDNIDSVPLSDEVLVNKDGSTARQSVSDLATQLSNGGAIADQITPLKLSSETLEAASSDQETRLTVLENGTYADAIPYATSAAGIADTVEGQRFKVDNADPDIAYDVYLHDAGDVATFVESQPSVAALAVKEDKNSASGFTAAESSRVGAFEYIVVGGLLVEPLEVSFDGYVLRGRFMEDGSDYLPTVTTGDSVPTVVQAARVGAFDPVTISGRSVVVSEVSFDGFILRGIYADNGDEYAPLSENVLTLPSVIVVRQSSAVIYVLTLKAGSTKYICYTFQNVPNALKRSDVWRLNGCHEADYDASSGGVTLGTSIGRGGEWETAILLNGRVDFAGGAYHGNHEKTGFWLFADGIALTVGDTGVLYCDKFEAAQASNLYDPTTVVEDKYDLSNPVIGTVKTRWSFTPNGVVTLTQQLTWAVTDTANFTYLAMVPGERTNDDLVDVTTTGFRMPTLTEDDISSATSDTTEEDASQAVIYGAAHALRLTVLSRTDLPNYNLRLSPQSSQNKIYPNITGGSYATTSGDVIDTTIEIQIITEN